MPWLLVADQLRCEERVERSGHRVVIAVAFGAHQGDRLGVRKSFGVANSSILGQLAQSLHHRVLEQVSRLTERLGTHRRQNSSLCLARRSETTSASFEVVFSFAKSSVPPLGRQCHRRVLSFDVPGVNRPEGRGRPHRCSRTTHDPLRPAPSRVGCAPVHPVVGLRQWHT